MSYNCLNKPLCKILHSFIFCLFIVLNSKNVVFYLITTKTYLITPCTLFSECSLILIHIKLYVLSSNTLCVPLKKNKKKSRRQVGPKSDLKEQSTCDENFFKLFIATSKVPNNFIAFNFEGTTLYLRHFIKKSFPY